MPELHGFKESLNDKRIIRKHTIEDAKTVVPILVDVLLINTICLRGELKRNKTGAERGELVTLLNEPYLAFFFNYLPSPPPAPAAGAMSVIRDVAYIAAAVELSLACLCSQLRYIVESQYQDAYTFNQ
jgi:hypothetical protein